jgi:chromosome segregation ATPase
MSEEAIARALASNEDFARKVADLIADKIVIKKIDELTKEVEKLSKTVQDLVDQQKLVWEKFEENDKKFNQIMEKIDKAIEEIKEENKKRDEKFEKMISELKEESKKRDERFEATISELKEENKRRDEKLEKMIAEMKEENKKRDEKFEVAMESIERENKKRDKTINKLLKQNQQILRTLENLTGSLEQEAIEHMEYVIKSKLNVDVELYRLELLHKLEIDIYGEFGGYVIVGEVKARAGISTLKKLEEKIKKLKAYKLEIEKKKIIPVIYAMTVTKELVESCNKKGVYLTNGYKDYSPLPLA